MQYLRPLLPANTRILWQHHGGRPPSLTHRWLERPGFRILNGVIFTTRVQVNAWRTMGMVSSDQVIYEFMEGSTEFRPLPREACRQQLDVVGDPTLLWVGRLNANKDPLTVLEGFAQVVPHLPNPHLYMIYSEDELLPQVRMAMDRLGLVKRVHLMGQRPREQLPAFYSAADFFVLASHHEGSGYALLEALACGLTPVVTDIPSFHCITDGNRMGHLWPPGSPVGFAHALQAATNLSPDREAIRQYFDTHWSFAAIGNAAAHLYRSAIEQLSCQGPKTKTVDVQNPELMIITSDC